MITVKWSPFWPLLHDFEHCVRLCIFFAHHYAIMAIKSVCYIRDVINCQDVVTELLEASSAQLSKSLTEHRSLVTTLREESSDESTVISSQTSTLTRNQGSLILLRI